MGTQNFFSLSHTRDKMKNIFLYFWNFLKILTQHLRLSRSLKLFFSGNYVRIVWLLGMQSSQRVFQYANFYLVFSFSVLCICFFSITMLLHLGLSEKQQEEKKQQKNFHLPEVTLFSLALDLLPVEIKQIKNFINTYPSHVVMKRHSHLALSLLRSYQ